MLPYSALRVSMGQAWITRSTTCAAAPRSLPADERQTGAPGAPARTSGRQAARRRPGFPRVNVASSLRLRAPTQLPQACSAYPGAAATLPQAACHD